MNKKIQRIIWNPQPRQVLMMSKTEFEALYGGAAGGGKSDYLLAEALRYIFRSTGRLYSEKRIRSLPI